MIDISKMNTSYPARIVSFDPADQTATIQIAIEAYVSNADSMYNKMEYSNVTRVPVHFPQCGKYAITFPIEVGDDCLAMFTQKGFEHWLYEAKLEAGLNPIGMPTVNHMRAFSKNDAMVFVGFNPIPKAIEDFSPTNLEIRSKSMDQFISIRPNGD
ncbi:MAG: Gp138 family membrane-puncturing spike protein, partial [Spirochaetia bacterium]